MDCLFCAIVAGEVPASVVHETEGTLAFRDIGPQAPTHVLVITREHHDDLRSLATDPALAAELLAATTAVATAEGLDEDGFRVVFNIGRDGGQSVAHVHAHVLGGRQLRWPPG